MKKLWFAVLGGVFIQGCGALKDEGAEISHELNVPGHWLMTESEHTSQVEKFLEKDSLVLTFKDGKYAFSPTDSVKGQAVFAALSACTVGPRPYKTDKQDLVFEAVTECPERRVKVTVLDGDRLKFTDPYDSDVVRTFARIDRVTYERLVKPSDRQP